MDPNACLQRIADADTKREQREACEDLHTWIRNGGFQPAWDSSPRGAAIYKRWTEGKV
jgi:hypothetical protein